jgi:pSer/pThr/pTyr-binding forkhead associated (FHA) protein
MEKNEISIGRSRVNDLVVPHKEVSSFHCKLVFHTDGSLWIHDMDSTNGVFVNGIRIRAKHRVMPGDLIRLGSYDLDWQQALLAGNDAEPAKEKMQPSPMVESGKTQSSPALKWAVIASVFVGLLIVFFNTGLFEKSKEIIAEVTQTWQLKNKDIVYDISCLVDETQGGKLIKVIGDTKKELMGVDSVKIDIKEEEEVGLAVKKQIDKEYKYSNDPEYTDRINRIFSKLRSKMDKSKFKYEIHVVESETINAFTAGGQIFVFTGIIDFAANDDELACIIGHEIYHNELGHIENKLKELKVARNWLGEGLGDIAYYVTSLLTTSFNQENEVYSDLYGLDLAVKAGYSGCAGIAFWERMQEKENPGKRTLFDKFMRSHPYSDERVSCNKYHIDLNYYHQCS